MARFIRKFLIAQAPLGPDVKVSRPELEASLYAHPPLPPGRNASLEETIRYERDKKTWDFYLRIAEKRYLTESRKNRVLQMIGALYRAGTSVGAISIWIGCTKMTVYRYLHRAGVQPTWADLRKPRAPRKGVKLTPEDVEMIRRSLSLGFPVKEVARKWQVSPKAIRKIRDRRIWNSKIPKPVPPLRLKPVDIKGVRTLPLPSRRSTGG